MTAPTGNGHLWGDGQALDDRAGAWDRIRDHRIYCTAVLAIFVATLFGAHWAGQPSAEIGTMSSSSVTVESLPPVE